MGYIKAITKDGFVRVTVMDSTDIVERARQIHTLAPVCAAALGRTLTATSMMGLELKGEDASLTLQFNGDGPIGSIVCVSDHEGNVRGYVGNPVVDLPLNSVGKLDVARAVGHGTMSVIKDLGLKEPYIGRMPIVSGEIAEDITNYFANSEQIPTVCALGVLVDRDYSIKAAGGYLIQLMPGFDEKIIDRVEGGVFTAKSISEMISLGFTPEDVLKEVLPNFELEILERGEREYRCTCSEERIERALLSLGRQELTKLAAEEKEIEVGCHFCEKKYKFSSEKILSMLP